MLRKLLAFGVVNKMERRLAACLLISGLFLFGCQEETETERKSVPKIYFCHQAISEIKIDGFLDESDWQKAKVINFYRIKRNGPQDYKEAESPAIGKLLWNDNNLYIGIEAEDKDIWATIKEHDGRLWHEDALEAFFKPDKNKPTYFEFEFSPKNISLDLMIPRRNTRSFEYMKNYESNLKSAVKVYGTLGDWQDVDKKWVLEVAIPFSAFKEVTPSPKPGDEWSFALCRYDYSVYLEEGKELSSSAKLSKLNFHLWEDYDKLLFQKKDK